MVRPLTHPDLLTNLVDFFPSLCTIQLSVPTISTTGQRNPVWANYAGHVDIPCRVAPAGAGEPRRPDITYSVNTKTILLRGSYPTITEKMRAVVNSVNYNIFPIQQDGQGVTTRLTVELVK